MKRRARLSVAISTGLLLGLTALAPLTSAATAAASSASPATSAGHRGDLVDVPVRALVERAIDPEDYECEASPLQQYVTQTVLAMTPEEQGFLFSHLDTLLNVPTYEPLIYGVAGDPDYALTLHAAQIRNSFRQVKAFWSDVKSDDIQLMAMHGDVLLDADRIARTNAFLAETEMITPEIQAEAEEVAEFMAAHPDFVDNPLWTLNAYAYSNVDDPDPRAATIPDKLVFGDGFLMAFDDLGLGDVGPRVVMGHEFGHHIQFELDLFEDVASPEATRRTELMADAYGAYFGVHKRGLALNAKRVVDTLQSFYAVGVCAFDDNGHHGTPNQRKRSAEWGAQLAKSSVPAAAKLSAREVADRFEAVLPELVAPDA